MKHSRSTQAQLHHLAVSCLSQPRHIRTFQSTRFANKTTKPNGSKQTFLKIGDPRTPIFTKNAPNPLLGLYSQAIVANGFVYCSGNVAMDPETNQIIYGDIQAHTHQVIKNLSAILDPAGSSINYVVKVNIFLADMSDFAKMNEVYDYIGAIYDSHGRQALSILKCFKGQRCLKMLNPNSHMCLCQDSAIEHRY
jgi:reactive intermediate/imine deaminase